MDLNEFLDDIPAEDVLQVMLQPGLVACSYIVRDRTDNSSQEPSLNKSEKKILTESEAPKLPYDCRFVDAIMNSVRILGSDNVAEMLQFLIINDIHSVDKLSEKVMNE
jgi:hypothetical protein